MRLGDQVGGQLEVNATAANGVSEIFSIPITADVQNSNSGNQLRIARSFLLAGQVGEAYSYELSANLGSPPYTWKASGLPSGLAIKENTISGTPDPGTAGTYVVTITVTDANGLKATKRISLTIAAAPGGETLTITTVALPDGYEMQEYNAFALQATGGTEPYTWAVDGLPSGLTYDSGSGVISGTPDKGTEGGYSVGVSVTDTAEGSASTSLGLTINPPMPLEITTSSLPDGYETQEYVGATLEATGGTKPYTWTVAGLPSKLAYDPDTGVISGIPDKGTEGPYTIGITVTDTLMATASASLPLTITGGALAITTSSLPDGLCDKNAEYDQTLTATGGTLPYAWTVSTLPSGLTYDSGTGQISGVPVESGGPCSICIQLDDGASGHAYVELPLSVLSTPNCHLAWTCTESIPPCS